MGTDVKRHIFLSIMWMAGVGSDPWRTHFTGSAVNAFMPGNTHTGLIESMAVLEAQGEPGPILPWWF